MKLYKDFYNYEKIIRYKNQDEKLYSFFNNCQNFPNELKNVNNLFPETAQYISCIDYDIQKNFEILNKELFDLILQEINTKNSTNLKINNIYQIYFGDNKIFIQDTSYHNIYFIYSFNNEKYELEYIILFRKNINLIELLKNCDYNQTFEEYMANYGINLNDINSQVIIDEDLKRIGDFYNIKQDNFGIHENPN